MSQNSEDNNETQTALTNQDKIKPRARSVSQTTNQTLFKQVKNYIILAMLILIFISTLLQSIRLHVFGGGAPGAIGEESLRFIELANKIGQLGPHLGAISDSESVIERSIPTFLSTFNRTHVKA